MQGLYGEYADMWTCPRCDTENDREFCGRCRAQKPYRTAKSVDAAEHAEHAATSGGRVKAAGRGDVGGAVLVALVLLALVAGVPMARSIADRRQHQADVKRAARLTAAAGQLPAGFHHAEAAAGTAVPAVVETCVLGGAGDDNTARAGAAWMSDGRREVLAAAHVVGAAGRARDVAAAWGGDPYRACLATELAKALSARPAGVARLASPSVGEQSDATRVVLALDGGSRLVVDVVAMQSARSIVTLGFAGADALPDGLRDTVVKSVAKQLS